MQKAFRRRSAELDGQSPVTRLTLKLQLRSLAVISRIVAPLNVPIANRCVKQDSASVGGIFEVFKMQSRADDTTQAGRTQDGEFSFSIARQILAFVSLGTTGSSLNPGCAIRRSSHRKEKPFPTRRAPMDRPAVP
jgi:hypothetical protein